MGPLLGVESRNEILIAKMCKLFSLNMLTVGFFRHVVSVDDRGRTHQRLLSLFSQLLNLLNLPHDLLINPNGLIHKSLAQLGPILVLEGLRLLKVTR
jgi:hypothetical protein